MRCNLNLRSGLSVLAVFGLVSTLASAQDRPDLSDHNQRINYAFGLDVVSTFQKQEFDIDLNSFIAGMKDSLAGNPALTPQQKTAAFKELHDYLQRKAAEQRKVVAAQNLQEGEAFLTANAQKDGVKVKTVIAPDGSNVGLQYKVLKSGSGPSPQMTDIVEVHYHGTRLDGSVFDSSVNRGTPATFGLNQVIPGWREALQMMKVGDKWRLFVPAKLAYGEFGPPQIEPNSTLIFEIELLSFYTPKTVDSTANAPAAVK